MSQKATTNELGLTAKQVQDIERIRVKCVKLSTAHAAVVSAKRKYDLTRGLGTVATLAAQIERDVRTIAQALEDGPAKQEPTQKAKHYNKDRTHNKATCPCCTAKAKTAKKPAKKKK